MAKNPLEDAGGHVRSGVCRASLLAFAVAGLLLTYLPPASADPTVVVKAAEVTMTNTAGTATAVTATCGSGLLVGGGIHVFKPPLPDPPANSASLPTNGLKVNGTMPSDPSGLPLANGATDPSSWTALGGFGGQAEANSVDVVDAFAMCASGGPAHTQVIVNHFSGDANGLPGCAAGGGQCVMVTAACPPNTSLLGGGASATPDADGSLKPIASYPSDANGTAPPDGATNPTAWTVVGGRASIASPPSPPSVTAFALCTASRLSTRVSRHDVGSPSAGGAPVVSTATCPSGMSLLSGGARVQDGTNASSPQFGVHLRGSFPSDGAGHQSASGSTPTSWTGLLQTGGTASATTMQAYALCAAGSGPPVPGSTTNPTQTSTSAASSTTSPSSSPTSSSSSSTSSAASTTTTSQSMSGSTTSLPSAGSATAQNGGSGPAGLATSGLPIGLLVSIGLTLAAGGLAVVIRIRRRRVSPGK